jgi:hypothetical protein
MSDPLSRTARNACDIIGSTLATCATTVAKNIRRVEQQVKTSHMLGRFVVTGAEQFIRTKYATPKTPNTSVVSKEAEEVVVEHVPVDPQADVHIPLEDYDLLTSSQVVELLGSMSPSERQAVWNYENAHRRRRTILESSRVAESS